MKNSVNTKKYFNLPQLNTKSKKTRNLFLVIAGMLVMCSYGQDLNLPDVNSVNGINEHNFVIPLTNSYNLLDRRGSNIRLNGLGNTWNILNTGDLRLQFDVYNSPPRGYGIEMFRFTKTGRLGIGTDNPNAPLQFANTIANRKIVLWEDFNNNEQFYGLGINGSLLRYQTSATTSDHAFFAGVNASTSNELMRIKGNGNVGIATNNPDALLHIADKFDAGGKNLQVGDDTYFSDIDQSNVLGLYGLPDNTIAGLKLGSGGETIWGKNSYIGIGTNNPQYKLDVNGNARFFNVILNGGLQLGVGTTKEANAGTIAYGVWSNGLDIVGGGTTLQNRMIKMQAAGGLTIDGSVGIGTGIPISSKLAVKGTVTALDYALVTAVSMPDYVFNSDYKLPSLQETEAYIKTNKHLPYFKSAKEMEANGYSLQDMDKGLLQSLEEMTLHSIAQEKEIKTQKEEIKTQKEEIKTQKENFTVQIQALTAELATIKALLLSHK
jgi:hypothetical protein